jgi:hypothetical protein
MEAQVVVLAIGRREQKGLLRDFAIAKKEVKDFISIKRDVPGHPAAVVSLPVGIRMNTGYGALLTEIKRPYPRRASPRSLEHYQALSNMFWLTRIAKSGLVALNCPHYSRCLDIAGKCTGHNPEEWGKDDWWGFSCRNCPYSK